MEEVSQWGLNNMYSSPDIIRQMKSRRMRWAGMWNAWERGETCTGFWWESPRERDNLEDKLLMGGWDQKCAFGRLAEAVWNGFTWLRIGTVGGLL
jgi:hypothetical protein